MVDVVSPIIGVISNTLQKYEAIHTLKKEVVQFRKILRAVKSVLLDVRDELERNPTPHTTLINSMDMLREAVALGDEVLHKCSRASNQNCLKQFLFSKKYLEKLTVASGKMLNSLSFLSAAGVNVQADIREGVEDVKEKVDRLEHMSKRHHDELLEQMEQYSEQMEALPNDIIDRMIERGIVASSQDYSEQIQDIAKEAQKLQENKQRFQMQKAKVDEHILLADESILQMVKHLSLNETRGKSDSVVVIPAVTPAPSTNSIKELLTCPISLQTMKDPVTVFPSGHTCDKQSICQWLLTKPDLDPFTLVRYDSPLSYTDNIFARQQLMAYYGDQAYQKYNDTGFRAQYLDKWKAMVDQRRLEGNRNPSVCNNYRIELVSSVSNDQDELYDHIDRLLRTFDRSKGDKALDLALAEPHDPICLVLAASIMDPTKETCKTSRKDAPGAKALYERAVEAQLLVKAQKGHVWSQYVEGLRQEFYVKNISRAVQWHRKAADQGHASAQCNLGWMYDNGHGVKQNDKLAVQWYQKAAAQGHVRAQDNLGWMYANGQGVMQSDELAVQWYRKAADQGDAMAQCSLGWMYDNGRGVEQSDELAVQWYRKAADQGHARAQNNLGGMYANGRGVKQNDEFAVQWYRKATDQGDASAQYNLGVMYQNGQGVEQSDELALEWYRKAADQGDADAEALCHRMEKHRQHRGIHQMFGFGRW